MKQKIFEALVLAKPTLDKTFAGVLATQLALTVTEESGIQNAISGLDALPISLEVLATEFNKNGDKRANDAVTTYKTKNPGANPQTPPAVITPVTPVDEPNAAILAQLKALQDQVDKQNNEKTIADKRAELVTLLGDKKIDASLASLITLTAETDVSTLLPTIEQTFSTLKQAITTNGLKENSFFPGGGGASGGEAAIASGIEAWSQSKNPAV